MGKGDGVLIGPRTRERIEHEFAVEDLGEHRLRNVEEPVRVFRLALAAC
jgi:class 3 adenylate cyclase